jgi:hypothetical protein
MHLDERHCACLALLKADEVDFGVAVGALKPKLSI